MRLAVIVAAVGVAAASAAAARNPHDPQERLTAADNATARAIVVHKSDLVGKWKLEKPDPRDDKPCKTFDPDLSDLTVTGHAESPDFSRADGVILSSEAEVYETDAQLRASFDRFYKPQKIIRCTQAAFREGAQGATVKALVARTAPMPRYGDRRARFQFVLTITENGDTVKAFAD